MRVSTLTVPCQIMMRPNSDLTSWIHLILLLTLLPLSLLLQLTLLCPLLPPYSPERGADLPNRIKFLQGCFEDSLVAPPVSNKLALATRQVPQPVAPPGGKQTLQPPCLLYNPMGAHVESSNRLNGLLHQIKTLLNVFATAVSPRN